MSVPTSDSLCLITSHFVEYNMRSEFCRSTDRQIGIFVQYHALLQLYFWIGKEVWFNVLKDVTVKTWNSLTLNSKDKKYTLNLIAVFRAILILFLVLDGTNLCHVVCSYDTMQSDLIGF